MNSNDKKVFIEKVVTVTLIVILASSVFYNKKRGALYKPVLDSIGPESAAFKVRNAKANLKKFGARRDTVSGGLSFRDPMKKPIEVTMIKEAEIVPVEEVPAPESEPPAVNLTLEGIIWGGSENLAIISGQVVGEGDMVDSVKVIDISENAVKLESAGKEILLKR